MPLLKYFQIFSLIVITGVILYFIIPKYTYFHPSSEDFIIRSNLLSGKIERVYFEAMPPVMTEEHMKEYQKALLPEDIIPKK